GDSGDFSNSLYAGFRVSAAGGTVTPFLESDPVLRQVNDYYHGNYLNEPSVVAAARAAGYATAIIGKLGPAAVLDVDSLKSGATLIVDDSTGVPGQEVPLSDEWRAAFLKFKVAPVAPSRGSNGNPGGYSGKAGFIPGTWVPNLAQQQYFIEVAVKVALPHFKELNRPFVLVFWSRDPDGTQHFHGDSTDRLTPGINGATSLSAIRNADTALAAIAAAVESLELTPTTDIVLVADHGFSTISKDGGGHSPAVHPDTPYSDVPSGELPPGFLAIDLYAALKPDAPGLELFDPDDSRRKLDWTKGAHPLRGNAILGEDPDQPQIVVAANGGSDLVYLPESLPGSRPAARTRPPGSQKKLAARIVNVLLGKEYLSGIFVDESRFGRIPGALSTAEIGIGGGNAVTPQPAIVVNFASRVVADCRYSEPTLCTAAVADTTLLRGQGMHGSFNRADTWNFMAARGPDFRAGFVDPLPASNADIGMTIAHILGLSLHPTGKLTGRVLTEALSTSPNPEPLPVVTPGITRSDPDPRYHLRTLLNTQSVDGHVYLDAAGFAGRTVGLAEAGQTQ
ncbi:MAG TPA: alkaline phosphatase family protein, partial [Steroidobacteraceae bacterium]